MHSSIIPLLLFLLALGNPPAVPASQSSADSDVFEFFAAEAQMVAIRQGSEQKEEFF